MPENRLAKVGVLFALALLLNSALSVSARTPNQQEHFSIIVIPDTQHYSEDYPWIFTNQTTWIVENKDELNISFVIHAGDIVDDASVATQWSNANTSMSILDGKVPYGIVPGNHDQNITEYEKHFPAKRYENYTYWGGSYDYNTCNYQLFSGLGMDFIVVNLGWKPDNDDIAWANSVLRTYSDRKAIVVTHGYMDKRAVRSLYSFDTTYIWDDLIAPNSNVFLVLCAHTHSEARRADPAAGRVVHQLLADYQDRPNGGNGWLRIIEFRENKTKAATVDMTVTTYSPFLGRYERDNDSQFGLYEKPLYPDLSDVLLSKIERALGRLRSIIIRNT